MSPDPAPARPRPRWLPIAALALPVVAVVGVLGARAIGGGVYDPDVAEGAVHEVAGRLTAESGVWFGGGSLPAGRPLTGSSTVPAPGPHDLTAVCASHRGAPAHLTVTRGGVTAGETEVACSDATEPGAEAQVTVLHVEDLDAAWAFEVVGETEAAITVLLS